MFDAELLSQIFLFPVLFYSKVANSGWQLCVKNIFSLWTYKIENQLQ